MNPRRLRADKTRLLTLLLLLFACIWLLYRLFIAVPHAPPPRVTRSALPAAPHV